MAGTSRRALAGVVFGALLGACAGEGFSSAGQSGGAGSAQGGSGGSTQGGSSGSTQGGSSGSAQGGSGGSAQGGSSGSAQGGTAQGGSGGSAQGGQGGSPDGGFTCSAGGLADLSDGFNAGKIDMSKWTPLFGGGAYAPIVANNYLELKLGTTDGAWSEISSYDLYSVECAAWVKVVLPSEPGSASFRIGKGDSDALRIWAHWVSGALELELKTVSAGVPTPHTVPAKAAQPFQFWRIRVAGGTAYFDTSDDGKGWLERWNAPKPPALTKGDVTLGADLTASSSTLVVVSFDGINST